MQSSLAAYLHESAAAAARLAADETAQSALAHMAATLASTFTSGGRLLIAGNGGSAADAAHLAAECVSRCHAERPPLGAISLAAAGPALTALANDYGPAEIFARQIAALGRAGDQLLLLSTSGRSPNLLAAQRAARAAGLGIIGFAGADDGPMAPGCDILFRAPSRHPQIVQQLHIAAGHALLLLIEQQLFGVPA